MELQQQQQQQQQQLSEFPKSSNANQGIIGWALAKYDYQATDTNELSFKANDLIAILQKDPSGWWRGQIGNTVGVFPGLDWVHDIAPTATMMPMPMMPMPIQMPMTMMIPSNTNTNTNTTPTGTATTTTSLVSRANIGQMQGNTLVNSHHINNNSNVNNFNNLNNLTTFTNLTNVSNLNNTKSVNSLNNNSNAIQQPTASVLKCTALFDYTAENGYEITMRQGDILTVESDDHGWFIGTNLSSLMYGRYPSNFVTLIA